MLPTFFIPGAAKAGSSTLHYYLNKHPDILMSAHKEPNVFAVYWDKGLEPYQRYFRFYNGQKELGEATVEYMVDPLAPGRIKQYVPNAKFIFSLRDPIKRANSHYWHRVKACLEDRPLETVLYGGREEYPIRYGLYYTHIKRFLEYFSIEQMHFVILERLHKDFEFTLKEILKFLEVDQQVHIENEGPKNVAMMVRSRHLGKFLKKFRKSIAADPKLQRLKRKDVVRLITRMEQLNLKPFEIPKLDSHQVDYLSDIFAPEIEGLETLLGYEIPEWKTHKVRV